MDFTQMSIAELSNLAQIVSAEIKRRELHRANEARAEIVRIAKATGISMSELAALGKTRKSSASSRRTVSKTNGRAGQLDRSS